MSAKSTRLSKKIMIEKSNRLYQMPPEIFSFVRSEKKPGIIRKTEFLDLGRFDWPVGFDSFDTSNAADWSAADSDTVEKFKETLAEWFGAQHGIKLNPAKEIFVGESISRQIVQLALAFIDAGDIAFAPDIGLPHYRRAIAACGGEAISYPITFKNNWLPDFKRINSRLGQVARMLIVNSPHNPSGAELSATDFDELTWMAGRENLIVVNDAAYQSFSERRAVSLLGSTGGKKVGVELYSFSYLLGLPPLPFGFAIGSREVISGLKQASRLIQTKIPRFVLEMAERAIHDFPNAQLREVRSRAKKSSAAAAELFDELNLERVGSDTIPFVWTKIEGRKQALRLASILFRRHRILTAPGTAFGENGEGFLRWSLTASPESYQTAAKRIKRKGLLGRTETTE